MPADSNRPRRIAEVIKRQLTPLIMQELDDPRVGNIAVTAVDVVRDLKSAKIFFVTLDKNGIAHSATSEAAKQSVLSLNQAGGFLRHCLRSRVELRAIPALRFVYDKSIEQGDRIESLLRSAHQSASGNESK